MSVRHGRGIFERVSERTSDAQRLDDSFQQEPTSSSSGEDDDAVYYLDDDDDDNDDDDNDDDDDKVTQSFCKSFKTQ